jgi:two-component system response regulator HydG
VSPPRRRLERSLEPEPAAPSTALLGECPAVRALLALLDRVAASDAPVLLQGESGTGKELLARTIHRLSRRSDGLFLAVNCGALVAGVLESELFGHVAGAFTGARGRRHGLFEEAHGGTLLLDEIASTPPSFQVKLLRVIEDGEVRPVGSSSAFHADVRVIAATNLDLKDAVRSGRFRQDLYYRLNVVGLELPPLRERGGDVELLARHFAAAAARGVGQAVPEMTPAFLALLARHRWPGNVRELRNVLERAVLLAEGEPLALDHLPGDLVEAAGARSREPYARAKRAALAAFARGYLEGILRDARGNVSEAARQARLPRQTLHRLMRSLRMRRRDFTGKL